ncbi:MAG: mechanosensitive ion channel [Bacteroidaceae bacterium]|nr:mechanosensitive ion channel [Bacteroidaceae bacterium]
MENDINALLLKIGAGETNISVLRWIIMTVGTILLFYISGVICSRIIIPLVGTLTKKTSNNWDDILLNKNVIKSGCDLIPVVILTTMLPFFISIHSNMHTFLMKICWVYITIVGVKLICAILTAFKILSQESERMRNHTLQGVFQMLKIIAICIGAIIIISTLIDRDPVKILAGLGASAAVLMLVFKDSIMGLVAGVQLSANDMLRSGDWITMPKYGADGFVIDVSLTTVKVQNWDKTITTVPPYALVSDSFQNWRGMFESGGRRIKRSLFIDMNSIKFVTSEQIRRFVSNRWCKEPAEEEKIVNLTVFRNYLEEYLHNRADVNKDMMILVRQLQPTPQGLPLELYFFFNGTAWIDYEHLQAEIFEYVFAILPDFGLKAFQSPAGTDFDKKT